MSQQIDEFLGSEQSAALIWASAVPNQTILMDVSVGQAPIGVRINDGRLVLRQAPASSSRLGVGGPLQVLLEPGHRIPERLRRHPPFGRARITTGLGHFTEFRSGLK